MTYANQYTKPFNEISGVVTELQTALASAKRVFAVIDEEAQQPDDADATHPAGSEGRVDIEGVNFSYEKSHPLIRDFNLHVQPGQRIALVGPTGCGKTTMINLLMRFYDVDSGEIRVDGQPVKKIGRNALRSLYGMVLQDTWMFHGSVRDNIAYGKPDATTKRLSRRPRRPTPTASSCACRRATTPSWPRTEATSRRGRSSCCASPAPCSPSPRC